jgi:hypothetical protein
MVDRSPLPDWSDVIAQKDAEITALTARVAQLEAALEEIVKPGGADNFWQCFDIARAALTQPAPKRTA